jgi:hypothetical protein
MNTPIFTGIIEKGTLTLDNPQRYLVQLASLNGKKIELILRKRRGQRSLQQNSYYWGVVIEILSKHFGYDPEEMHEALKFHFLKIRNDKSPDLVSVKSTTRLSTDEFNEYVNRVVRWAAQEYGVFIPDPRQVEYRGWRKAG